MSRIVEMKRFIPANMVNANGYMYDEKTLKESIDKFIDTDASVRKNKYSIDEINKLFEDKQMTNGKFDIVGQLLEITDTHIKFRLLEDLTDDELAEYTATIHVWAKDIDVKNEGAEDEFKLATIDVVDRIIIGKY